MKKQIKSIIRFLLPNHLRCVLSYARMKDGNFLQNLLTYKVIAPNSKLGNEKDYVRQMDKVFSMVRIDLDLDFVYPFDTHVIRALPRNRSLISSITVDFGKVLSTKMIDLEKKLELCDDFIFKTSELRIVASIRRLVERIVLEAKKSESKRKAFILNYFPRMLDTIPTTFEEALQKLLFFNALFWQANHWHIGLGRLDKILYPYYEADIRSNKITKDDAMRMLASFCAILHKDMYAKSLALKGDTGQYILLGGIDEDGNTIQNDITVMLLKIIGSMNVPDPKLILRVNDNTNSEIWQESISCIKSGCGSPLLMNETLVMQNMARFGYDSKDVVNVGTSACWEPLIIGKSFDQNNPLPPVVAVKVLNELLLSHTDFDNFGSLLEAFKDSLANAIMQAAYDIDFDCSPLFTLFFDDCIEKQRDFTKGGARYAYHGMQVVSFPNTINSLLNIKRFVFDEQLFSLTDCVDAIQGNFEGFEDMLHVFKNNNCQFGSDNEDSLLLTNEILALINETVKTVKVNGQKVKIGISSPSFILSSQNMPATLDGRKYGEPFAVHISPVSEQIGIKEICDFAGHLDYLSNCLNGNVVDFILPSAFANEPHKLEIILRDAIHHGVFELQLNVLNVEVLRDAKLHPEKHRDLVVRVWGFSAYFNDLPDAYKDYLIKRAELYAA